MPLGFVGGRSKPFALTQSDCRHLGLTCLDIQNSSVAKAWQRLMEHLNVAATRLIDDQVEVVDTVQQGTIQRVSRSALESARHAGGPMSAKARAYTITGEVTAEAAGLVPSRTQGILKARDAMATSATLWTTLAGMLDECAADGSVRHLREAASLCRPITESEVSVMEILAAL